MESNILLGLVQEYGSPLNVLSTRPMSGNAAELSDAAVRREIDFRLFFARKANKCLAFVDEAIRLGAGVDVASENELRQALSRGAEPQDLICTAAIKSQTLVDACIQAGRSESVVIAIDNEDELDLVSTRAQYLNRRARIAIRLGGFSHEGKKLPTRFGFDVDRDDSIISRLDALAIRVDGLHFHLDGYDSRQRVSAISQSLHWFDTLHTAGHTPTFLDIGGGMPMSYLDDASQWSDFWQQLEQSLLGKRPPMTYRNNGIGLRSHHGEIVGHPDTYPNYQSPIGSKWFANVLDASHVDGTIAEAIKKRGLQLRCEPGRSLMNGCGMTVARVEFRKRNADGDWLIGLAMNGTQCKTSTADFLVDPILIPCGEARARQANEPAAGYLVGAYCMEEELLSLRRLQFPHGIQRGDLVVFPNTAGYQMHFMESRSHQFPLALNVVADELVANTFALDAIDC
ncbi:MAG: Y4yA family PLP-dependent enzyme [Pirellulaceae bacterium]